MGEHIWRETKAQLRQRKNETQRLGVFVGYAIHSDCCGLGRVCLLLSLPGFICMESGPFLNDGTVKRQGLMDGP